MSGATNECSRSSSKAIKALCRLNSRWPTPQVLWLNKPLALLCKLSALPAFPLECHWATHLSGVVTSSSGQIGPEDTFHSEWSCVSAPSGAMSQLPCLGRRVKVHSMLISISQKSLSSWERPRAILSFGYELIPLPRHSTGILQSWYWICSGDDQLCLPFSWLEHHWAAQLPGVVTSPPSQMGREDTLYSGCGCDSASCLSIDIPGSRASKTPCLKMWTGRSASCQVPWSKCAPDLVLQMSKATGWDYLLLGHCRYELCLPKSVCWLLQAPPPFLHHSQIPSNCNPQVPLQSSWYETRARAPTKQLQCQEVLVVPPGFSFPTGGTGGSGEVMPCDAAALASGRDKVVSV